MTQRPAVDEVAELHEIRRDLYRASLKVWDSDPEVKDRLYRCPETLRLSPTWDQRVLAQIIEELSPCLASEGKVAHSHRLSPPRGAGGGRPTVMPLESSASLGWVSARSSGAAGLTESLPDT